MSYNRNNKATRQDFDRLNEDSKLDQFSDNHSSNVDRRVMERGGMFNTDSNNNRSDTFNESSMGSNSFSSNPGYNRGSSFNNPNSSVGEITGQHISVSDLEQGMPARSFMDNSNRDPRERVEDVEQQRRTYNPNLDFDLFDHEPQTNVSYYDPSSFSNDSNFSNINNSDQLLTRDQRLTPVTKMVTTINSFSWEVLNNFNSILKGKKTLIMSPLSILQPLMILYRGSSGSTEQEFQKVLSFQDKNTSFAALQQINTDLKKSSSMLVSNTVYIPKRFPISKRFIEHVKHTGSIDLLNTNKPDQEAARINDRVRRETKNMIKSIIEPSMINQNTCMILLNTIYFFSRWKSPFNKNMTRQEEFFSSANKRPVYMMHQKEESHRYFEDAGHQVIELDYSDREFCFGAILPRKSPPVLVTPHEQYEYYVSKLRPTQIDNLKLPRFSQQSKLKVDSLLKKMGMRDLFIDADLSEMTPTKDIVYVSDIIHQAVIILNEEGTEASAATAMMLSKNSAGPTSRKVNFIANHPFTYYIRHKSTNSLVFVGSFN
jgi:serpin B